jgi:hypothetical protein
MRPHALTARERVSTKSDLTRKVLKILAFKELVTLRFTVKNVPTQSPIAQVI